MSRQGMAQDAGGPAVPVLQMPAEDRGVGPAADGAVNGHAAGRWMRCAKP